MTLPETISADYTLRPSELAEVLALLVEARQPTMVWGPPGAAKSMIARQVAVAANRQYVDVRALLLDRLRQPRCRPRRPAPHANAAQQPIGPSGEPTRILVVDDDPQTLRYVRDALAGAGYAPLVTGDPGELSNLIRVERPALVQLDLILPGTDGIELMEQLPGLTDLPVIFISGYGRDETIARALQGGAADYIVKPFSQTELVARVGAALRHRAGAEPFVLGELAIDHERRRATVAGRAVSLTATEYELLRILSVNAGRVVTSESLLRQVWDRREPDDTEPVCAFVKQLRAKLGDDAANPAYIFTERGVGYRMPRPGDP